MYEATKREGEKLPLPYLFMEESEIRAPLYYVIGRDMDGQQKEQAHHVLLITPCMTGVVSRHSDNDLIKFFVSDVLQANDESACREIAAHVARTTQRPVLIVDAGNELTAVYPDGEEICLFSPTYMNLETSG